MSDTMSITTLAGFRGVYTDPDGVIHPVDEVQCCSCEAIISGPLLEDPDTLLDLVTLAGRHECLPHFDGVPRVMLTIPQAAERSGLHADQIRRWCVTSRVEAIKQGGRWLMTEGSLTAQVAALDDMADILVGAGGNLWREGGKAHVYFNEFWGWAGLILSGPGEAKGAAVLDGKLITVDKTPAGLRYLIGKVYVDLAENMLVVEHFDDIKTLSYRTANNAKRTLQLLRRLCAGFTKATGLELGVPTPMQGYRHHGTVMPVLPADKESS